MNAAFIHITEVYTLYISCYSSNSMMVYKCPKALTGEQHKLQVSDDH